MGAIAYFIISGLAFFVGGGIILIALLLPIVAKGKNIKGLAASSIVGIVFVALSATPLPLWFYALWAGLLLALAISSQWKRPERRVQLTIRLATIALTAAAIALEIPWQFKPSLSIDRQIPIYVIGDSISAGIGGQEIHWPDMVQEQRNIRVVNLASAGSTISAARKQAMKIGDEQATVILEIGGNDLLGNSPSAATFEADWDGLIQELRRPGRTIVMFELPLPPMASEFGAAQRRLALKYDIPLVPKRILAGAICGSNNTLDSLHLSEQGHRYLAQQISSMIQQ